MILDSGIVSDLKNGWNIEGVVSIDDFITLNRDFGNMKDYIINSTPPFFEKASEISNLTPLTTSLDFLFGEPLMKGEVTSIEGNVNSGKTRLCAKIACEVAKTGNVLYIDVDHSMTYPIFDSIIDGLGISRPSVFWDYMCKPNESSSLTIASCIEETELFSIINSYISHTVPDLIVIDSLFSLLQSLMGKNSPGFAVLEEISIELKFLAKHYDAAIIVVNSIKEQEKPLTTYLGKQYSSMWHQRLILITKNSLHSSCHLVCSPRKPHHEKTILLEYLTEYNQ